MEYSGEPLAPLGFDLVGLIGVSDRFAGVAAEVLEQGLQTLGRAALDQEARAGLGEALAIAYYKAIVLLQHQSALMKAVTELLLRYRFLCSLQGLEDRRSQDFWLRHGLDRELLESEALHATARLAESRQVERHSFGRHLAAYFALAAETSIEAVPSATSAFTGLEAVVDHLWWFRPDDTSSSCARQAYLLAPHSHIGIVGLKRLCSLVADVLPLLAQWCTDPEMVICAPLGTRKVSLAREGMQSCSTYFDGGKPVPFSLNRSLEPYLVLTPGHLTQASDLVSARLWFAPLLDSLSTLVFRDSADYRLGEHAFQHQAAELSARSPLLDAGRGLSAPLPTTPADCLVEGLLVQAGHTVLALTPCHRFSDHYARSSGLSGHGPSGVMNQSVLVTSQGVLSTWRYERNFDSWSGRSGDVARHPSLNFLAWEPGGSTGLGAGSKLRITPLTYSGYPSECKIEDLRLFAIDDHIYAIAALILSRARYRSWLPDLSSEAAANNTIDDMLVVQSLGRLDLERGDLRFEQLPVLHRLSDPEQPELELPRGFEKNWLLCPWRQKLALLYSIQPWQVFEGGHDLRHWRLAHDVPLGLPDSIQGPLRNSAHPFPLPDCDGESQLGLVVHRRRHGTYIYDQYLLVLSADTLLPLRVSREPILSVNAQALGLDLGFRKNQGVCYVSSVLVRDGMVQIYFNLFDCRTCVLALPAADLRCLIDNDAEFVSLSA